MNAAVMRQWFGNIQLELEADHLDQNHRQLLRMYYEEAGLLTWWKEPFFHRHFSENVAKLVAHVLNCGGGRVILDLGCGMGTQALLLALSGAKVIGVDMDSQSLAVFRKRKSWYEDALGASLDITIVEGNAFEIDYRSLGPIGAVYSIFAFNMMQPSRNLLDVLGSVIPTGGRMAILDGNQEAMWSRVLSSYRRSVLTPTELKLELHTRGFVTVEQCGGVAIPPQLWRVIPGDAARCADDWLCKGFRTSISCLSLATKG